MLQYFNKVLKLPSFLYTTLNQHKRFTFKRQSSLIFNFNTEYLSKNVGLSVSNTI